MSAISIADRAFVPRNPNEVAQATNPFLDALAALARYIPAEGLALYIAVAAFGAAVSPLTLVGFVASIALSALIIVLKWVDARETVPAAEQSGAGKLFLMLLVTLGAQTIYICALAGNPLTSGMKNGTVIGGVAVLVVAAFLSVIGPRLFEKD